MRKPSLNYHDSRAPRRDCRDLSLRALAAATTALVLGCSQPGDPADSEGVAPSTGEDTAPGDDSSGSTATATGTSTPTEAGTDSTATTGPGEDTSSGTSGTTGDPVDGCQLADDNVACDALVGGRELASMATGPGPILLPAGRLTLGGTPTAVESCDIYAQDCPADQKCNPYGMQWDAVGCFPLAPNAGKLGDPCSFDGTNGPDTCEAGAMCLYDPALGGAFCEPLCGCAAANPTCGANEKCVVYNGGALPLCQPLCDPFDADSCAAGEVCVKGPFADFFCEPDLSGEAGVLHDPCQSLQQCDPGHSCEYAPFVPGGCGEGVQSCCTPLCDLAAPVCPEGSHCLEYFGGFGLEAPVCLEDVGYCVADEAPLVVPAGDLR